jgi:D-serine deaminase-like pyridoxal phosphate-dependent protein
MEDMNDWYRIANADSVDSPCLAVYPLRVAENIRRMVAMVDEVDRIRPHVKTHKTAEGIRMMMEAGVRKFKCATIAEAELLGICGAPDVVLAYQPHGPKLQRFLRVMQAFPETRYACLTDNALSAERMSAAFHASGCIVPVYIDLNVGMNRSYTSGHPACRPACI